MISGPCSLMRHLKHRVGEKEQLRSTWPIWLVLVLLSVKQEGVCSLLLCSLRFHVYPFFGPRLDCRMHMILLQKLTIFPSNFAPFYTGLRVLE